MQTGFTQDIQGQLGVSFAAKGAQLQQSPGGFEDLLQSSLEGLPDSSEAMEGRALPAPRQAEAAEDIKKDTHSTQETQVSTKDTHLDAQLDEAAPIDIKVNEKVKNTHLDAKFDEAINIKIKDTHLDVPQLNIVSTIDGTHLNEAAPINIKDTEDTQLNALPLNVQSNVLTLTSVPLLSLENHAMTTDNTDNVVNNAQEPIVESILIESENNQKTNDLDRELLEKLQGLLSQSKSIELAISKEPLSKIETSHVFKQLLESLPDNAENRPIQQALQGILGLQKQDTQPIWNATYQVDLQGKLLKQVNEQIVWMTQQDIKQARLTLEPANLGSMDITIAMHKNEATIHFFSNNHVAKQALESNLHHLSAHLAQEGITLMQANVQTQQQGQQAFDQPESADQLFLGAENAETVLFQNKKSGPAQGLLNLYV